MQLLVMRLQGVTLSEQCNPMAAPANAGRP
jgi:hypothetical protein